MDGLSLGSATEPQLVRHRRARVGFIFQSFNLLPTLTALENVESPMVLAEVSRSERRDRAGSLLESVGLAQRILHKPNELSGGEKQRVAIARALANRPSLLLADEPTGNLDSKTGAAVLDLLCNLVRNGLTLVMVTHDPEVASRADRIFHLRDGNVQHIDTRRKRRLRHDDSRPNPRRLFQRRPPQTALRAGLARRRGRHRDHRAHGSLASGVRRQINRQFESIGLDRLTVNSTGCRRGDFSPPGFPFILPQKKLITAQDVKAWKALSGITKVVPEVNLPSSVGLELNWNGTNQSVRMSGGDFRPDIFQEPPEAVAGSLELPESGGIVLSQGAVQAAGIATNDFAGVIGQTVETVLRTSRGETQSFRLRVQGISQDRSPTFRFRWPTALR